MSIREVYSEKEVHERLTRALATLDALQGSNIVRTQETLTTMRYAEAAVLNAAREFREWYEDV